MYDDIFISFLLLIAVVGGMFIGAMYSGKAEDMCHQWAGESAIIHDGRCMVPTQDGGLRPARMDGEE
jgi:hypothetical protein